MISIWTVEKLCEITGWSLHEVYRLASLPDDPLPLLYRDGYMRGGILFDCDFYEWMHRTGCYYNERRMKCRPKE